MIHKFTFAEYVCQGFDVLVYCSLKGCKGSISNLLRSFALLRIIPVEDQIETHRSQRCLERVTLFGCPACRRPAATFSCTSIFSPSIPRILPIQQAIFVCIYRSILLPKICLKFTSLIFRLSNPSITRLLATAK